MQALKISIIIIVLNFLITLIGCQTTKTNITERSFFKIEKNRFHSYIYKMTPDRIFIFCNPETDETPPRWGFSILLQDTPESVIYGSQTNTISKEACEIRMKEITKIIKNAHYVYYSGIGDGPDDPQPPPDYFKNPVNGQMVLIKGASQFISVWNDKNECFGAYVKECPPYPFTLSEDEYKNLLKKQRAH